ncbi:MAG: hypothetical protein WC397_00190 [Candidatus Paceibacterota bacterium]|jgi:hypothetical protein
MSPRKKFILIFINILLIFAFLIGYKPALAVQTAGEGGIDRRTVTAEQASIFGSGGLASNAWQWIKDAWKTTCKILTSIWNQIISLFNWQNISAEGQREFDNFKRDLPGFLKWIFSGIGAAAKWARELF